MTFRVGSCQQQKLVNVEYSKRMLNRKVPEVFCAILRESNGSFPGGAEFPSCLRQCCVFAFGLCSLWRRAFLSSIRNPVNEFVLSSVNRLNYGFATLETDMPGVFRDHDVFHAIDRRPAIVGRPNAT